MLVWDKPRAFRDPLEVTVTMPLLIPPDTFTPARCPKLCPLLVGTAEYLRASVNPAECNHIFLCVRGGQIMPLNILII